jgi:hypothetical protein
MLRHFIMGLFAVLFFQRFPCFAQVNLRDTLFVETALEKARDEYTIGMEGQSNIYSGTEHPEQRNLRAGHHPFFLTDDWSDGSVLYDGEFYNKVSLMYDISVDKLIVEHYYNHSMVQLFTRRVDRFSFMGHNFIRISANKGNLTAGLYELLYDGDTKVLAKHEKMKQRTIQSRKVIFYYIQKTRYYILKDGAYQAVKDKSSLLGILEDQKPVLKKFVRDNKVDFRRQRGKAIAQVAEFYDTVKK